jgi:hypothetical protein
MPDDVEPIRYPLMPGMAPGEIVYVPPPGMAPGEIVYVPPRIDVLAVMHVLEQIKTELRTLAAETSLLASEVANIRRQLNPPRPWRS